MIIRRLLLSVLLLLPLLSVSAQESAEYDEFIKAAGDASTLYRGAHPTNYPIRYNGNYYWGTKNFEIGTVVYNGKWYGGVLVNINANLQELLLKQGKYDAEVSMSCDKVDKVTMGSRVFINLRNAGFDMANGFYELLYSSDFCLYKRVDKILKSDTNAKNEVSIGYFDPDFNPDLPRYFQYSVAYYVYKDGIFKQIKGRNDIWKFFTKEQKKEIKGYLRSSGKYDLSLEDFYIQVCQRRGNE